MFSFVLRPLEVRGRRISEVLSYGGQSSDTLVMSLELRVVLEGVRVEVQHKVDGREDGNVTGGQLAAKVVTVQQVLEGRKMFGHLYLQSILPCLGLVAGSILGLRQDIVEIVLLFNELLRPEERKIK